MPPPPDWDDAPLPDDNYYPGDDIPVSQDMPSPSRRENGRRKGPLTMAERLVLVLLDYPSLAENLPLPDGVERLPVPHIDLLIRVAGECKKHQHPAALMGALMAHEQGESFSQLLKASLKPPMAEAMATRLWQDALSQLEVARLEAALMEVEQAGIPDVAHWQALHKALAEARQHARKPFD